MLRLAAFLIVFVSPALAEGQRMTGAQIQLLLENNTAIATGTQGTPWRQFFADDGSTLYYSGSRPASLGKWQVRDDQYCSLWPPARNWECYDLLDTAGGIIWKRAGATPDASILYQGDRTLGALPEGHPK